MATTQTSPRESAPQSSQSDRAAARSRRASARPNRVPTDDEILGLDLSESSRSAPTAVGANSVEARGFSPAENDGREAPSSLPQTVAEAELPERHRSSSSSDAPEPENLRATFDANPELRQAWHDAHSYRESFATPDEARAATALLADLDRLDALFFSRRPEDHAELSRAVAALDPDAFASLARAMAQHASSATAPAVSSLGARQEGPPGRRLVEPGESGVPGADPWRDAAHSTAAHNSTSVSSLARPTVGSLQSADEGSAFTSPTETQQQIPRTSPRVPENQGKADPARGSARNDSYRGFSPSVEAQSFSPAKNDGLESPSLLPQAVAQTGPPGRRLVEPGGSDESPERHSSGPTLAQLEFFHSANAAAVRNVLDAIESQVERLLPDGVSKSARNRVVGEIYRELDSTLQSNRQLAQHMRDAFRSGAMDANHQRAVVSLITGRARQALPGVAKRVLSEWTSTIVAANHDRRARQRAAESRVDIAGSGRAGNDGIRPMSPRDIDYARLSDSDILNM